MDLCYPETGGAVDGAVLGFVEDTARAFKKEGGALVMRFDSFTRGDNMLGFKFSLISSRNGVRHTEVRSMQFETSGGGVLKREDILAEGHEEGLKAMLKSELVGKLFTEAFADELLAIPGTLDNFWLDGDWLNFCFNSDKPRTVKLAVSQLGPMWTGARYERRVPDKLVALTFDDGPNLKTTPMLLDILKEYGAEATFFVIGQSLEGKEDLLKRMAAEGHEIGSHSYSHAKLTALGAGGLDFELDTASDAIADITGRRPSLLRPPYGCVNDNLRKAAAGKGFSLILWDVDPYDWKHRDAKAVSEHIINQASDGDIILLHDIYATSVEAARIVIKNLSERGFGFVTVSELLSRDGS
jgi:peptidoglycan/xylan/chitin deacetylase (PgdA/CDA1 family)